MRISNNNNDKSFTQNPKIDQTKLIKKMNERWRRNKLIYSLAQIAIVSISIVSVHFNTEKQMIPLNYAQQNEEEENMQHNNAESDTLNMKF